MPGGPLDALRGVRVLDLSDDLAGSYCTKLLVDAGAEVLKVEPAAGHPLRTTSRSGSVGADGDVDGALFRFLAAGQRSVGLDLDGTGDRDRLLELAAGSDVVVSSASIGVLEARRLRGEDLQAVNPALTVVSITPFGLTGPRAHDTANDFRLQARSGSLHSHGSVDREPLAVGGGLGEWIAGAYAAAGALAARARTARTGRGEVVDVSALECLAITLVCYPSVAASFPGGVRRRSTYVLLPGIEPCKDGFVGLTTLTAQQWHDFLAMIDRHDLIADRQLDGSRGRVAREAEVRGVIQGWTRDRTVEEVIDRAVSFRVPAAPVLDGASLPTFEALTERALFDRNPRGDLPHPRPPFRSSATRPRPVGRAPAVDEHGDRPFASSRSTPVEAGQHAGRRLPLEGVRVLDFTAFWAGPTATQYLATLGADVIKVESVQRPDAIRFNVHVSPDTDRWWEQGYLYAAANLDKRGITLNLGDPRGRSLFLRLVALSDVLVENYTPRVVENFGLTYDVVSDARPDIVMVRMPGWGLDGPWRDRPGFATTMEQAAGMAFVTGYKDGPPLAPGLCDPLVGIHGAFAVLAALEERRRTGRGQHVELSMIDMAVNVAAEQILEWAAYGSLMTRRGNRSDRCAPQGVYECAGADEWLALSVSTEAEWWELCRVIGVTGLIDEPDLASVAGRQAAHDRLDAEISAWCARRPLAVAVEALRGAGAEPVAAAFAIDEDEQMQARGFWESVVHPVVGEHRYPGWPMRLSGGPTRWHRSPAPLVGEHNEDVLGGLLGLNADELAHLRTADVIGERPFGL